jgi:hypothetical protein
MMAKLMAKQESSRHGPTSKSADSFLLVVYQELCKPEMN